MMRAGWKFQTSFSVPILFKNGDKDRVSWGVVNSLEEKGILTSDTHLQDRITFRLTELGQTIKL
jgi:hypothetical protein